MSLPPERSGLAAPADLAARRAGLAAAVAAGMWRTDPAPREVMLGGVRCLRFSPSGPARGMVLHMHGGAFRIGCPEQMGPFATDLAARCRVEVICPAYRLAPEAPFPAGLNDGWAVLRAMAEGANHDDPASLRAKRGNPEANATPSGLRRSARNDGFNLILSGDSAGGGLAASLAALSAAAGIRISGLALLSPWLDLGVIDPSYTTNAATDPLFSAEAAREAAALYLQGHDASDPLASPLKSDVAGFPPTYLNVGTGEVLAGDAEAFRARLVDAGVPVTYHPVDGMEHVAVTRDRALTGSAETFEALVGFVAGVLGKD